MVSARWAFTDSSSYFYHGTRFLQPQQGPSEHVPLASDTGRRDEVLPGDLTKASCPQGAHRPVVEGGRTYRLLSFDWSLCDGSESPS